jgi:predicted methyltransferase
MMPSFNQPRQRFARIGVMLFTAVLLFVALSVGGQAVATLQQLTIVEAERDTWQRPDDVIRALDLHTGSSVVDLGSGAGYFALKLSRSVGSSGSVVAIDVRRLPLAFLFVRAILQRQWNLQVVKAGPTDPELPKDVDAILVANTYHELTDRGAILDRTHKALRLDGRLVILDRGPREREESHPESSGHQLAMATVEADLLAHNFTIVTREDPFIDQPPDKPWWLIVASKR